MASIIQTFLEVMAINVNVNRKLRLWLPYMPLSVHTSLWFYEVLQGTDPCVGYISAFILQHVTFLHLQCISAQRKYMIDITGDYLYIYILVDVKKQMQINLPQIALMCDVSLQRLKDFGIAEVRNDLLTGCPRRERNVKFPLLCFRILS